MKSIKGFFLISFIIVLHSCNSIKVLQEGEVMLVRNEVEFSKKSEKNTDLIYYVRPISNKKFLDVFPIKTSIYSWGYPKYNDKDSTVKDTKFKRWLRKMGEEPVLLDTTLISYSERQLKTVLMNDGFFEAEVSSRIKYIGKKQKKAKVIYMVNSNDQYYVRKYNYDFRIPIFSTLITRDTINSLLKSGMPYSADKLVEERTRMTTFLRNNGYYYFDNSLIYFEIDTIDAANYVQKNHKTVQVNVILSYSGENSMDLDKIQQKYQFKDVYIQTNYDPNYMGQFDTVAYKSPKLRFQDSTQYYFITPVKYDKKGHPKLVKDYRYHIITTCIRYKTHQTFNQNAINYSYLRFNESRNFVFTDISFKENQSSDSLHFLNSKVLLTRSKMHAPSIELTARNDKVSASVGYINRNFFKGAEIFKINIYAATDLLSKRNASNKLILYAQNTELGGDINLDFPRLLFIRNTKDKISNYKTTINLGVNYQHAVYYKRLIYNMAINYYWMEKRNVKHSFAPLDISFVKVDELNGFDNIIGQYSKPIQEKYKDHMLMIARYTFSYSLKPKVNQRHFFNFQTTLESCGNILTGFMTMLKVPQNKDGKWVIFGVNYSNYVKLDLDFRYSYLINKNNSIASRISLGLGIPLFNSGVLPFERSFYLGGSNSMRGWTMRTLGPGSYYGETRDERIGDMKLELNLEYRGTIYKFLKYGIFADAGNIWLYKKDDSMLNAEFAWNRFYKEIALDIGAGLRFDFNFFLIRIDLGIPIYDPNKLEGERVIGKGFTVKDFLITFGINHAF